MDFGSQVILIETVLCSGVVVDAYVQRTVASHGTSAGMKARLSAATGTALFLLLVGGAPRGELGYGVLRGLIAQGICGAIAERVATYQKGAGLTGGLIALLKWTAVPAWFVGLVFLGVAALGSLEAHSLVVPFTGERWILVITLIGVAPAIGFVRDCVDGFRGLRIPVGRTIDLTDPERDPRLTLWLVSALLLWGLAGYCAWTAGEGSAILGGLKAVSIACTVICFVSMLPRTVFAPVKSETKWACRMERLEKVAQAATLLGAAALLAPGI